MENVYFCCPVCQTRYQSMATEIKSSKPFYKCRSCSTVFSFKFPFQDKPTYEIIQTHQEKTKACALCGALNYPLDKECYSCQVVFEKLPKISNYKESPLLVRKWNLVLDDFENYQKHQDFIEACRKAQKVSFALEVYKKLKEAQGGEDSVCDLRIIELEALSSQKRPIQFKEIYIQWGVVFLASILIVIGAVNPYYRNFVGFGVFLCVFLLGFERIKKGRWG